MKYLKYILGTFAMLVMVFLLIGVVKPQLTYEYDIMVDKPLAESWAVSQDEEKMSEWLEGFQKIEPISGTPGEVGSVSDVYFMDDGQEMVIRETITDIKPNQSISMLFTSDFMDMDYKLVMEAVDGKTKISSNTNCKGNGMVSKSLVALMGGFIKGQEETNLMNLKNTIEGNSKDYFAIIN
ncbi:SRPBCC family protein [Arenibacter amylolyticus]|uniref:SRPBCC family protein n=1 Tax=Arenibacter amylolyticus TaxID=1406873 RepID=UPI000A37CF43|nr:SRPBCC family protein [Arenibacter amylolyticus]